MSAMAINVKGNRYYTIQKPLPVYGRVDSRETLWISSVEVELEEPLHLFSHPINRQHLHAAVTKEFTFLEKFHFCWKSMMPM